MRFPPVEAAPAHYRALLPRLQGQVGNQRVAAALRPTPPAANVQRAIGFEYELDSVRTRHTESNPMNPFKTWVQHGAGDVMLTRTDYNITADVGTGYSRLEFVTRAFDERTEIPQLMKVVKSIIADLDAIKKASRANTWVGYGAGSKLLRGGDQGWLGNEGWVGLDAVPGLNGSWQEQVRYAASDAMLLVGKLQMTAGFTLEGLQRLMSGNALGNPRHWRGGWTRDARQYITAYARLDQPTELYRSALAAVVAAGIAGARSKTAKNLAGVVAAMAQPAISWRNGTYDAGQVLAKTDYAKLLAMVAAKTTLPIRAADLLQALLAVVNAHLPTGSVVTAHSPVSTATMPGVDLTKVSFQQWVENVVPQDRTAPPARDLMAGPNYPGTAGEQRAMRAYGPYGSRTDPGDKAIFELRDLMNSTVTDLPSLVNVLVKLMQAVNKTNPDLPVKL